ncbi:MAG: glycoside hydrolase family 2 TIM barrel-domain containing protein [Rikenellaceae bacterium]
MKDDEWSHDFGMRKIGLKGRRFVVNDKELFVRGNLMCGEAPIDGEPEMSYQWWYKTLKIQKDWGFNAIRFHSWAPPKAAFEAADKLGMYLQAEASEWANVRSVEQKEFIDGEIDRMIHQYGNHPSFIFIAMGNELSCDSRIMKDFVTKLKKDNRRWVSGKINGAPVLDSFDFYSSRAVNRNDKFPVRAHIGWPPSPKTNTILSLPPSTARDYSASMLASPRPFISHEIGQYCVFPNYKKELPKYVGSMRATVLEIERDQVRERAMEDDVERFSMATGLWQKELYKFEMESIMRSREIAGYHLLSFQDFPGQSHAPVGVFDSFWENKGHIQKDDFREFCAPVTILARIKNQILTTSDTLCVDFEVCNYSSDDIVNGKFVYELRDSSGKVMLSDRLCVGGIKRGANTAICEFKKVLKNINPSSKYTIHAKLNDVIINQWSFWLFDSSSDIDTCGVMIAHELDSTTKDFLNSGGDVLLLPRHKDLKGELPQCFGSIYWTSFGLNEGETMCNSILCDPKHPLFKNFPTESHTNWQWWDILINTRPMILDEFGATIAFPKEYKPLIQAIDSWKINRKLAILSECRVGKGKLMICSVDFSHSMDDRPASRQLYRSIIEYMRSDKFNPKWQLSFEVVDSIFDRRKAKIYKNSEGGVLPTEG